jgi:transposase
MEGLQPLHRRVAGIDVHRMLHVATLLIEQADGSIERTTRQFGGFRRDCRALAAWLAEAGVELVVMESTGIYWKSVFAHLERAGVNTGSLFPISAGVNFPTPVTFRCSAGV